MWSCIQLSNTVMLFGPPFFLSSDQLVARSSTRICFSFYISLLSSRFSWTVLPGALSSFEQLNLFFIFIFHPWTYWYLNLFYSFSRERCVLSPPLFPRKGQLPICFVLWLSYDLPLNLTSLSVSPHVHNHHANMGDLTLRPTYENRLETTPILCSSSPWKQHVRNSCHACR